MLIYRPLPLKLIFILDKDLVRTFKKMLENALRGWKNVNKPEEDGETAFHLAVHLEHHLSGQTST